MTRPSLPPRRPSVTEKITIVMASGSEFQVLITVGFADDAMQRPIEVFCADFKAGTDLHSMVMDSCIALSRLLQHGDDPEELAKSFSKPRSMLGFIAMEVSKMKGPK